MRTKIPVTIAPVQDLDDVQAIATLYPTKPIAEQEDMIQRSLQPEYLDSCEGNRTILLAKSGDLVLGAVQVVWENEDEDPVLQAPQAAVIYHLRTHPQHQGHGIGHRLIQAAEHLAIAQKMDRLTLGVEPENAHAYRLYQKWGFSEFHRYQGREGESLLGMQKWLKGASEHRTT